MIQDQDKQNSSRWGRFAFLRSEQVFTLLVACLIGVAAAGGAMLFKWLIHVMSFLFWGEGEPTVSFLRELPWYMRLLLPIAGGLLIAPLVTRWARGATGSGIPEVIEAVALRGGAIRRRVAPLKTLAASITIGSGGSAGPEGPIVHIGASIGSWISQALRCKAQQARTFVACGSAAGLAAIFNTPFAGALFAIEVILANFAFAKVAPIVIACIVATAITRELKGDFPLLESPPVQGLSSVQEIIPYLLIGIVTGALSALFILTMRWGYKALRHWTIPPLLLPAAGGVVVGVIGVFVPEVFGIGYDTINTLVTSGMGIMALVVIIVAKMVATSATIGSGGSGGVFAPALFLGAASGGLVGAVMSNVEVLAPLAQGDAFMATCVLVGTGAMVASTNRAPIFAILMIFELTYQPAIVTPLMAACIPSVLVSAALHRESIYVASLTNKGIKLPEPGEIDLLKGKQVELAISSRVDRVPPGMPLRDLVDHFLRSPYPVMWMVDEEDQLLGVIESQNIQIAMLEKESLFTLVLAEDVSVPVPVTIRPGDDLSFASRIFSEIEQDILPVVEPDSGRIVGDILRSDVIQAYNRELAERDAMGTAADAISAVDRLGTVDLGGGYQLAEYEVPVHLSGKTLKELELRRRHGLQVILVTSGGKRHIPGPDTMFQPGDHVLFAGEKNALQKAMKVL